LISASDFVRRAALASHKKFTFPTDHIQFFSTVRTCKTCTVHVAACIEFNPGIIRAYSCDEFLTDLTTIKSV
jgi:hypothetical protein